MINPEKKLTQWRENKPELKSLFYELRQDFFTHESSHAPSYPSAWGNFIQPLLNGLYANDPDISFCSYMWAFYDSIEEFIDSSVIDFCLDIINSARPAVVPVFHNPPCDGVSDSDILIKTGWPIRAPRHSVSTAIQLYYPQQIYHFLCCVALQIIREHPSTQSIANAEFIKNEIDMLIQILIDGLLIESPGFSVNLLMPMMDEMGCAFSLTHPDSMVKMDPHEEIFLKMLYKIVVNDSHWIGMIVLRTAPILQQIMVFSSENRGLVESLVSIIADSNLLSDLLNYQVWLLTDILKTMHAVEPKTAEMLLSLLNKKVGELGHDQQAYYYEVLFPIYCATKDYMVVKIEHDNIEAWLQQLPVQKRASLLDQGLYILTKSCKLYYKKQNYQQQLSNDKNISQIMGMVEYFPKKFNTLKSARIELLSHTEQISASHKVIFRAVNATLEASWLSENFYMTVDYARIICQFERFEDSFNNALKLVLATIPSEQLPRGKKYIFDQWNLYTVISKNPSLSSGGQYLIASSLIYGFWDFLTYQHVFPACVIDHFKQIFGDFTDCMLESSEHLQYALRTIDQLNSFNMREPKQKVYHETFQWLVHRLFQKCLIAASSEENRKTGLMEQILKNIAELDEKQVPILSKFLLLFPDFQDYLRTTLVRKELDKHKDIFTIDPKDLIQLIEQKILAFGKAGNFPPIPSQTDNLEHAYSQAMLLLILSVLIFRDYKEGNIFKDRGKWKNWILSFFTQLHQQDRATLLGKCLAELVTISNAEQFIPESEQARFRACLQINTHVQGKSIEDILEELAELDKRANTQSQTNSAAPATKKNKKRKKTPVDRQPAASPPLPVINEMSTPKRVPQALPKVEVEIEPAEIEEASPLDRPSKWLKKSIQQVLQFIKKNPPEEMKISQMLGEIIRLTEEALIELQKKLKFKQLENGSDDTAGEQDAQIFLPDQQKEYAIQWNRLLSQCSVALLNYATQEENGANVEQKKCCEELLTLFNGRYFRDPVELPKPAYDLIKKMDASEVLSGWDLYMTGGVCLDEDFLDIDLMLVRNASYISTEDIKQAIWPKVVSQLGIQSKKVFDDANCVQYEVKIPLKQGILKLDATIYTQVSNESKVVQDTRQSLVSTGAMRWKLDGRMLLLSQTALAIYAKKPVLKVIVSPAELSTTFIRDRNKIGYVIKQMCKFAQYRLDPVLLEVLQKMSHGLKTGVDANLCRLRLEEALTYLLDEKRFSLRPQAYADFLLNRFNLIALLYTSEILTDEFHQACVAGFKNYFGTVLENKVDFETFTAEFTNNEFLAMYFLSGLLQYPFDYIPVIFNEFAHWPTIGSINTNGLLNILHYLPMNIYQCFLQQQVTQGFIFSSENIHPAIAATRILQYGKFPGFNSIQPTTWDGSIVRVSPGSDAESSCADSGCAMPEPAQERARESYGRFHQPTQNKVVPLKYNPDPHSAESMTFQ